MNYGQIKTCDIANGVGVRVTLFVSGCTNYCYNCFQPQTWDFHYGQPFDAAAEQIIFNELEKPFIRGLSAIRIRTSGRFRASSSTRSSPSTARTRAAR